LIEDANTFKRVNCTRPLIIKNMAKFTCKKEKISKENIEKFRQSIMRRGKKYVEEFGQKFKEELIEHYNDYDFSMIRENMTN